MHKLPVSFTVAVIVINRNHGTQTLAQIQAIETRQQPELTVCLIELGCNPHESLRSRLEQLPVVTYYDELPEEATLAEAYNLALDLVRLSGVQNINLLGEIFPLPLVMKIGRFDARYHGDWAAVDWYYRATGKFIELAKWRCIPPLTAYFQGRNYWFFIKLRLHGRWFSRQGWIVIKSWLRSLVYTWRYSSGYSFSYFMTGSWDGIKLCR